MTQASLFNRREFVRSSFLLAAAGIWIPRRSYAALPADDPLSRLDLAWTSKLPWDVVVDVTTISGSGEHWDDRLRQVQQALSLRGGGVIFFPPGTYRFQKDIYLLSGIVFRGAEPNSLSAQDESFSPAAKLEFPKYVPSFTGEGAPVDGAFKGIILAEPGTARNCGLAYLAINRGYIAFGEGEGRRCGPNRFVFGCLVRNAAGAASEIPGPDQPAWLRYTAKFRSAIRVHASENALVANNRVPKSGDDSFVIEEYPLKDRKGQIVSFSVEFEYDNRPGIYVNHHCIGGVGGSGNDGTPETHPWGFRKGSVIRDNYVFNTGRCAIGFSGEGVVCSRNVVRYEKGVPRPTVTGIHASYGSATNDNRALEMRGWRWVVEDNDYEVYSNICSDGKYRINDGEGLMHEDHCNSNIVESRLVNNRGNSYLSLYHVGGIDGLHVEGNDISTPGRTSDIYVTTPRHKTPGDYPIRRVSIVNNTTRSNGILVMGRPAEEIIIKGNRHVGATPGVILNEANAEVSDNENYGINCPELK